MEAVLVDPDVGVGVGVELGVGVGVGVGETTATLLVVLPFAPQPPRLRINASPVIDPKWP
ncbi:hypothetical protein GCM10011395_11670 [Sphingomonas psychrolutea]|uniref:Uncharacterized protein n=1 Tax=Sphingomonas psychrolutea TaxID=1259676 RepID=A0ABQ1GGB9_9SPHN|nr:hypothetical protein GCM10011395_11670 [Sphingomonas psychrolutea]